MPKTKPVIKISSFSRSEIAQLFKKARVVVRCTGLRILVAQTEQSIGRVLIVTPKASGTAPERNLFKRRIRAIFREHNLCQYSKDLVVICNKRGVDLPFSKLLQLLVLVAKGTSD